MTLDRNKIDKPRKISKEAGVQLCADMLFKMMATGEIVRELMEKGGVARSTIEKWLKEARPKADILIKEAENIRRRESEAAIAEHARKNNITREGLQERLWAIVNGNLQDFFTKNNNAISIAELPREKAALLASVEVDELYHGSAGSRYWVGQTKKFRLLDPLKAADMLNKMNGWYKETEPVKLNLTIGYGKEVPV